MKTGDLVKFNDLAEPYEGLTGVILRTQMDQSEIEWFEILSQENIIIAPEYQVSLVWSSHWNTIILNKESKKAYKNNATLYKKNTHLITLYT